MLTELKDFWVYREVLKNLTAQQIKVRYRRSALGFLWTLLNPLLTMAILTLVFSKLMRFPQKEYAIYLFSGLVPWTFLSQSVDLARSIFITNEGFLRRIYVPKVIFPFSVVLSNLANFILSLFVLFILGIVFFNLKLTPALIFLPISVFVLIIFTSALAIIFAVLTVFYRDFSHLTNLLLMLLFYGTPIIYPADMLPQQYLPLFLLNPMYHILELFHQPIYYHVFPSASTVLISVFYSVGTLCVAYFYVSFNRYNVVYRL